jgi:trimeric autotransporter adhesin
MHQALGTESKFRRLLSIWLALILAVTSAGSAEYHGQVVFNGLGIPGAVVTASRGDQKLATVTDAQGGYSFSELSDGVWKIGVDMQAFSSVQRDVTVGPESTVGQWELQLLSIEQFPGLKMPPPSAAPVSASDSTAGTVATPSNKSTNSQKGAPAAATNTQTPFQRLDVNATGGASASQGDLNAASASSPTSETLGSQNAEDLSQRAADGFLINGTANNSASSPFALNQAFGNNRRGTRRLYNGGLGFVLDNSALDARSYSLSGVDTRQPAYNHMRGTASFGGPLRIPHLAHNGPNFFAGFQWIRNRTVQTESGLVPTLAERNGDLSLSPSQIYDPINHLPFADNRIPSERISQPARFLLNLYPLPNVISTRYNYQVPIVSSMHQEGVQTRLNKAIGRKNQVSGTFGLQSTRSDNPTILGFLDTNRTLGYNLVASWQHSFTQRLYGTLTYDFSRQSVRIASFFEKRENISNAAGISGNNQEPVNWGPPALSFLSGLTSLSDAVPSSTHNQTHTFSPAGYWNHGRHNFSFGADYRKGQSNIISQQNPRGSFTFTGASTLGSASVLNPGARNDLAGFLLGIPDTASIAFGNADKYFRPSSYDAYGTDDWRVSPSLTLNIGVRWEYWAPIMERYNRLVNLDISPGFSAVAPVVAQHPVGPLTGASFPDSLLRPDRGAVQPRIGFSWRPIAASSMLVRGGYGIYYNTSPYQYIASQMAQQSPLSKSLSLQNTLNNPLTLTDGFTAPPNTTTNTYAVDPNVRVGYVHTWQLSVQHDLPGALQLTVTYQGSRGRHALQEFLPNTYPVGAINPCPSCPSGFIYLTSNGTSSREAGTVEIRRRLHHGLTSTLQYTFSKSLDDAAPGGKGQAGSTFIAQDWLNPQAERALSSFDRRHVFNFQFQYTTGMGVAGGMLLKGWRGSLFKEWTLSSDINAGSGLPLTPIYPSAVIGTGVTGPLRPDYTGMDIYAAPPGQHLNPAAYTAPASGHWGNAGRNSITGPAQFAMNTSLSRTFRTSDRTSLDLRVETTNVLNHVTFPSWNATVGSAQFGLPMTANPMRSVQTNIRWRF